MMMMMQSSIDPTQITSEEANCEFIDIISSCYSTSNRKDCENLDCGCSNICEL